MKSIIIVKLAFLFLIPFIDANCQEVSKDYSKMLSEAKKAQKEYRIGDAIEIYERIIQIDSSNEESCLALGTLYSITGEYQNLELSVSFYKKYLELKPKSKYSKNIKNLILDLEKMQDFSQKNDSTYSSSQEKRAEEYAVNNDTISLLAIEQREYVEELPSVLSKREIREVSKKLLEKAGQYERDGRFDSAIAAYNEIVEVDTSFYKVYFEVGRLWNKYGDATLDINKFGLSIDAFDKYLSLYKIKSKQYPKGEKDSTKYYETLQIRMGILEKKISLESQISNYEKYNKLLNLYEGMWVSGNASKDRMVPQWIFNVKNDTISKLLLIELHPASQRFSDETPSQVICPKLLDDGSLVFRFNRNKTVKPSQSDYYLKHLLVDLSNPAYYKVVTNQDVSNLPEDYFQQQREIDYKLHGQLEEQLMKDISKAGIEKTEEEFFIRLTSDSTMYAVCMEIIANPKEKRGSVIIDTIHCDFYKVPKDMTFIMLGRKNKRIQNKDHTKSEVKQIGFTKWNNWSKTGNIFKHLGYITLSAGFIALDGYAIGGGMMVLETYRSGVYLFSSYLSNSGSEKMMRNPKGWNTRMYKNLLNHYYPGVNISTKSCEKLKEKKKKLTKQEKEELKLKEKHDKESKKKKS